MHLSIYKDCGGGLAFRIEPTENHHSVEYVVPQGHVEILVVSKLWFNKTYKLDVGYSHETIKRLLRSYLDVLNSDDEVKELLK